MNTANKKNVGLIRRFAIMFYDAILFIALLFFASILVAVPFDIEYSGNITPEYILYIVYIHLVAYLYLGWCWTRGGQTLGLKTWKIRLISDSGIQVTWLQALLRYIGSLLCWGTLGLGFLWCYTNKQRRALNDIISKTHLTRINAQGEKQ